MINCNSDHYKHKEYITDLCDSNFENNLDATIANTSIKKDHINNGCVYSDINNKRQNLMLRLLLVIGNIKAIASTSNLPTSIIVFY